MKVKHPGVLFKKENAEMAHQEPSAISSAFSWSTLLLLLLGVKAIGTTNYVWQDSPNPTPPYSSWETAAHVIQDAADTASDGDTVLVTNGVYRTGGRPVGESTLTNRVAVDRSLHLLSVNGSEVTIVEGAKAANGGNGDGAIRCVYLTNGASVSGFTLTNGATRSLLELISGVPRGIGGGGVSGSSNSVVSDCLLTGNSADFGGGASGGKLNNCTLKGNSALDGGGAVSSTLYNCILIENTAASPTAFYGFSGYGGGALRCVLYNCTVVGNSAKGGFFFLGSGGGTYDSMLTNCIAYYNSAFSGPNYAGATPDSTCTYPFPTNGVGNITNAPLFVDTNDWADLRLQPNSPCIDAGNNDFVTTLTDLDGNPRIINGIVDMGAYEFVPLSPAEQVAYLILLIDGSDLRNKRPLLASLEAALASIERGSHYSAMAQLGAFQSKAAAQVNRHDPVFALKLMLKADEVIAALQAGD